jgi:hypothetical protein
MKVTRFLLLIGMVITLFSYSCNQANEQEQTDEPEMTEMEKKVNEFASFKLTTDLTKLTEKEKQMLPILFEAAEMMNELFWIQAFGDKQVVLTVLKTKRLRDLSK